MHKLGRTNPSRFFAMKRRILVGAATLIVLLVSWSLGAPSLAQMPNVTPQGSWTMRAPLPSARGEVAAVALDGKLHAIGGSVDGKARPFHDEYDPATNTWRARAPLPEARDHLALAVAGGKIFAFGGFTAAVHKGAGTDAFEYDPAADRWSTLPPMKVARGSAGAATVDGKIHVIGGRGPDAIVVAAHEVFDPKTGTWSEAAPLPTARDHMAVVAFDGKIHVIGGRFKGPVQRTGLHDVYDPKTGAWSSALPMPNSAQRRRRRVLSRDDSGTRR